MVQIDGNDSSSIKHKEEIHIFHMSTDVLINSILNNNEQKCNKPRKIVKIRMVSSYKQTARDWPKVFEYGNLKVDGRTICLMTEK